MLLILLQTACSAAGGGVGGAADTDPWEQAIAYAQSALASNPDLAQHLRDYQSKVSKVVNYLSVVDSLGPVLDRFDDFKDMEIGSVNVWNTLMAGLDLVVSGASDAIAGLESGLRDLISLRQSLVALSGLDLAAQAVEAFQAQPTRQTLESMAVEAQAARSPIQDADQILNSVMGMISGLLDKVSRLERALDNLGILPLVPDELVSGLGDLVSGMASPLRQLEGDGEELHQLMQQDVGTLDDIIAAAEYGRNPSTGLPQAGRRAASGDSTLVFVILGALAGGAALVGGLMWYGRQKRSPTLAMARPPEAPVGEAAHLALVAQLVAQAGPLAGQQFNVPQSGLLIGRSMSCGLRLEEQSVSRSHALLRFAGGAWFIQDQQSTGGTFVNGSKTSATRLNPGDQITIGSTTFIFQP